MPSRDPSRRTPAIVLSLVALLFPTGIGAARAENVVEVPMLAAVPETDLGAFELMLVWWDRQAAPDPIELKLHEGGVHLKDRHLHAMASAFRYALERTPQVPHTGTVSVQAMAYVPTTTDGPSAGAALAVGFIAVLKGDVIRRGVALTGTVEPDGRIGPVSRIPDKIRAAAREGYRTVLIPAGQMFDARWNLNQLGLELNLTIREVDTIDEAYELMTGRRP